MNKFPEVYVNADQSAPLTFVKRTVHCHFCIEYFMRYCIEREIIPWFQPGAPVKCGARKQATGSASEQITGRLIAA